MWLLALFGPFITASIIVSEFYTKRPPISLAVAAALLGQSVLFGAPPVYDFGARVVSFFCLIHASMEFSGAGRLMNSRVAAMLAATIPTIAVLNLAWEAWIFFEVAVLAYAVVVFAQEKISQHHGHK